MQSKWCVSTSHSIVPAIGFDRPTIRQSQIASGRRNILILRRKTPS